MEVERVLLDVRVLARDGTPVRGLRPRDFDVRIDGQAAKVEAVEWHGDDVDGRPAAKVAAASSGPDRGAHAVAGPAAEEATGGSAGTLRVLLFQRDLEPSRIGGLVQCLPYARPIVDGMRAVDRIAVLVYDTSLHLVTDFTSDRAKLREILEQRIARRDLSLDEDALGPAASPVSDEPSLARTLDLVSRRGAAQIETALVRIGEALAPLPGAKDLLYFGWGMGKFTAQGVITNRDHAAAVLALRRAHTTLFTVDVTQADYHSLEGPMIEATRETGGLYVKAYPMARRAVRTVRALTAGRYVLVVLAPPRRAPGRDGEPLPPRAIRIRLDRPHAEVVYRDLHD